MAISLSDIKRNTMGPPRIVLYGVPGVGKTTLAAQIQGAVWLPAEDGLAALDVPAFPQPTSYEQCLEAIDTLLNEPHDYSTFVVDSLSAIELLLVDYVVRTVPHEKGHKVASIEGYGYGKGVKTHAPNEWRNLRSGLDALRAKGMQIVIVAHSMVEKFEDPTSEPYDRYQVAINRNSEPVIYDWADAVLFMNYEVAAVGNDENSRRRGVGTGKRRIYTSERPSFRAKNRYRMPFEIPVAQDKPQEAWAQIEACIEAVAAPQQSV